ncbi:MAG TPA: hypothetical protein VLS89_17290 [Candidatus Nanopelagicales bacterium]|nr:hypothetical protein [Candidatus Nanopelagicales bacterium]
MAHQELFAKRTFALETAVVTSGGAIWQDPPEIRLEKVQSDGFLMIRSPHLLEPLTAPWPEARAHEEVMVELKMPGDHVDRIEVERALLRRQARQVQRLEDEDPSWLGEEQLWVVAPHVPEWLTLPRRPVCFAPGCYRVEPLGHCLLWIAANELPLRDELVPFLVARSGRALDEFARWVVPRRPLAWLLSMLKYLPMSTSVRDELIWRFAKTEDPEVEARERRILDVLLEVNPQKKQALIDEGRLTEARAALRRVLARRQLVVAQDDEARIEACSDLVTLERWLDQAVTAPSVSDALR